MRGDVQFIFKATPQKKQVMFFSATMPKDIREVARKFMNKVRIIPITPITLRYFQYKFNTYKLRLHIRY